MGSSSAPQPSRPACPACGSALVPDAVACMDCGYLFQPGLSPAELEGPPNLCPNPACSVANPPGDRNCQRCATPLPIPVGTLLLGRYRLEKLLNQGGFSAVYLAADTQNHNRLVAVKDLLCPDPQEFTIRLRFFRQEADVLRSLQAAPVVPRVHDFVQQGQEGALFVLEWIKAPSLHRIMEVNEDRPFAIEKVIDWGKSLCYLLDLMHHCSPPWLHRDLAADNIVLLDDLRTIKVINFSTACPMSRPAQQPRNQRVYTEGQAPLEQTIGRTEPRSDLFTLAATLHHLATGRPPDGPDTAQAIAAELASPNCSYPAAYRWFFEVLRINLAEDPHERYCSAAAFKADLESRQVTHQIPCPRCRHINPVQRPYCAACQQPLTPAWPFPCETCGHTNHLGSRFCVQCGHRVS